MSFLGFGLEPFIWVVLFATRGKCCTETVQTSGCWGAWLFTKSSTFYPERNIQLTVILEGDGDYLRDLTVPDEGLFVVVPQLARMLFSLEMRMI